MRRYKMQIAFSETTGRPYARAVDPGGYWLPAFSITGSGDDDYGWVTYKQWSEDVSRLRDRIGALEHQLEMVRLGGTDKELRG